MRHLYYRPEKVSRWSLYSMAILAVVFVVVVEKWTYDGNPLDKTRMLEAATRSESAFEAVRAHRKDLGLRTFKIHDPARTGMLGPSMSLVTTLPGHLDAKQTSVNPNFAAVVVKYLLDLGVAPGDRIGVGCTGSFPAINIAVLSAVETLGLEPVLVSSTASSQFGANDTKLMWPDIELLLSSTGILKTRSTAISRGGFRDNAAGMTEQTRVKLDEAIARSGIPMVDLKPDQCPIDARMDLYLRDAELSDYVAYINVGGGFLSVGGTTGTEQLGGGLIRASVLESEQEQIDSVAHRFLAAGVPLINMIDTVRLARKHGLPIAPTEKVAVGDGKIYESSQHRRKIAFIAILLILLQVLLVIRPPLWLTRLSKSVRFNRTDAQEPGWMV